MEDTLLNISEVCERLRIGRTRLYQILNSGQLKAVRLGKRTLIPASALEQFTSGLQPFKLGE